METRYKIRLKEKVGEMHLMHTDRKWIHTDGLVKLFQPKADQPSAEIGEKKY